MQGDLVLRDGQYISTGDIAFTVQVGGWKAQVAAQARELHIRAHRKKPNQDSICRLQKTFAWPLLLLPLLLRLCQGQCNNAEEGLC